jgi:hypothetical protein
MDWGTVLGAISVIIALLSIPLTIFSPIFTPTINDWYVKRSVAKTEKSIMKLERELETILSYKDYPDRLFAFSAHIVLRILVFVCFALMLHVLADVFENQRLVRLGMLIACFLVLYVLIVHALKNARVIKNVLNFYRYREDLVKRINTLKDSIKKKNDELRHDSAGHEQELFIFHANAEHKTFGNIWHGLSEGSYFNKFLSTDLSKLAVYRLLELKELGKLSEANVIGLYYRDGGLKTACIIKLLDFSYNQEKASFSFEKIRDTNIKCHHILKKLGKKYSHFNGGSQLIVRTFTDVENLLNDKETAPAF